jgi:DNA invertase Pin-like site-specific DNA recombinase
MKRVAAYTRVSSSSQSDAMQVDAIEKWAAANGIDIKIWESDCYTGTTMARPGWKRVWDAAMSDKVDAIVVWKLDRLGRTTLGLVHLFEQCIERDIRLISLTDGIDLSTANGQLLARMLAAFAEFERTVRAERQAAGIAKYKEKLAKEGRRWPGGKPDGWTKANPADVVDLRRRGLTIAQTAKVLGISRASVCKFQKMYDRQQEGTSDGA